MQAKYDARNPTALKQLVANKVRLRPFPKPVLDASGAVMIAARSALSDEQILIMKTLVQGVQGGLPR
jgi:TRAP-type mannitol/chloroaromatic compound transport system substrate-binding protein